MFIVSTKAAQSPMRINDIRLGSTIEEAMAAGDRLDEAAKYHSTLRIWKLSTHEKPILVAEREAWRGGESTWQYTARGKKLIYGHE